MENFGQAVDDVRAYDPSAERVAKTLVIPPASRSDRVADPKLDAALAKIVDRDLDLPRIGEHISLTTTNTTEDHHDHDAERGARGSGSRHACPEGLNSVDFIFRVPFLRLNVGDLVAGGSWTKGIANSALLQLWVGAGDDGATQGTGLHCDICNNFIVQLDGSKIWEFIHPKYSALLRPTMKRGKTAISGSDISTKLEVLPFIPRMEATIHKGDFMYNPDWYWHTVRNAPGFAMAVVARECNVTNFVKGNQVFSGLILTNHVAAGLFGGDNYALKRLKASVFGKSLMVPT